MEFMKTTRFAYGLRSQYFGWLRHLAVIVTVLLSTIVTRAQGTMNFNAHAYWSGTNYYELGMQFRIVVPTLGIGSPNHDGMAILPPITSPSNVPYNITPYMIFYQQFSPDDYVVFSLTNGYTFGLTSVNLADPNSPSLSPVPISFIGFLASGSTVTNTFTTPGNGATNLLNYSFDSTFISGLSSVAIQAPRWAMDNLVFGNVEVPEPGAGCLLVAGLLVIGGWKLRKGEAT
jgi:hypothetical protein